MRRPGQTEKLLDELQFQVFQCGQHDLAYVKKLKEQTSTSRWPELRERLLAGKTLPGDLREAFLAQEGLYARLMDRVAALESLQTLDRWEDVLRPQFPERMRDAYIQCLDARMRLGQRPETVCRRDLLFKKAPDIPRRQGCGAGSAVAETLPRRRSMLDELGKAGY